MALETGVTYIEDLVDTNPVGATDNVDEGDDHIRNIKTAVQGSFPSLGAAAVTKTAAQINDLVESTSGTATDLTLNTSVSGTAILDEDDLATDSNTQLATQQSIKAYVDNAGARQVITAVDAVYQNTTSVIPADNTVPTTTEGTALVDVVITPELANSKLKFEFTGMFTINTSYAYIVLTLIDVTGNTTLFATGNRTESLVPVTLSFSWTEDSPGTSANTYRVKYGAGSSATVYANGNNAQRLFGGVAGCRLTVTEIL